MFAPRPSPLTATVGTPAAAAASAPSPSVSGALPFQSGLLQRAAHARHLLRLRVRRLAKGLNLLLGAFEVSAHGGDLGILELDGAPQLLVSGEQVRDSRYHALLVVQLRIAAGGGLRRHPEPAAVLTALAARCDPHVLPS